jgi:hypothetical protein
MQYTLAKTRLTIKIITCYDTTGGIALVHVQYVMSFIKVQCCVVNNFRQKEDIIIFLLK